MTQAVLDEISAGGLKPGTRIIQEQIAQALGVSRQPVQQALRLGQAGQGGKQGVHDTQWLACQVGEFVPQQQHHTQCRRRHPQPGTRNQLVAKNEGT